MKFASVLLTTLLILGVAASAAYAQEDQSKNILKEGLMGAATGAIASSASGGEAGKGALIGAGVNVVGGALLDTITAPAQPAPQPVQQQVVQQPVYQQVQPVAVPSPYQQGYNDGYQKGFEAGYDKGYTAGVTKR